MQPFPRTEFRGSRAVVHVLVCLAVIGIVLCAAGACLAADNRFVILSDLQDWGELRAMKRVTEEVIALRPAFVVQLGDACGPMVTDSFRRMREAGIEIHIATGNHDGMWRGKLPSALPPFPFNSEVNAPIRFGIERKFYYSFNRGGIHFVIVDACDGSPEQIEWLEDDLGRHVGNPSKSPALVFLHYPEWMTGVRGGYGSIEKNQPSSRRPLYGVLEKYPKHTVKAVFGGHWHYGQNFRPEEHLGVQVYAVPGSALFTTYAEYIVATVKPDEIVLEKRVVTDTDEGKKDVTYYPIPGNFTNLVE